MVRYRIIAVILGMLFFAQVFHTEAVVVINEVLADPPSGDRGDANRDGTRDGNKDEFVEILNTGSDTIAIGRWQLSDRGTEESKRFAFPSDTVIAPGEYIVLFGGGDTTKIRSEFEGKVFVDDGKIGGGLSNSKDAVFLFNPTSSDTIARAEWGKEGGKDQSLVRYPEGTGRWVLHSDSPGRGLFSPGKPRSLFDILQSLPEYLDMIEGEFVYLTPAIYGYETGETRRIEDEVLWVSWDTTIVRIEQGDKVVAVRAGETEVGFFWNDRESLHSYIRVLEKEKSALVISEVYPNPAWGDAGDTNGDGVRHTYQDEFVEVANLGEQPIDISGYFLGDNDAPVDRLFRFPDNTVLDTQAVVVLFGGGEVPVSDQIFADDGRIGDGLSNWSDTVQLLAPDSSTVVFSMTYEHSTRGISFARDGDGNYVLHNQIYKEDPNGQGAAREDSVDIANRDSLGIFQLEVLVISEVYPNPATGNAGDTNGDGVQHAYQDEFVEVANLGEQPIDISGYFLGDDDASVDRLFRFPDNTVLDTQGVIVLFGGGEVPVSNRIFADDGRIGDGLSNRGDTVQLLAPDGSTVISKMTYENAPKGISFARDDNGNYLLHNQIYEEEAISVGRLGQGDDPVKLEELTVPDGLVFSEILMLPKQVDANNDGVVDKHADAFVELTNIGVDTLDLSGWLLGDDDIIVSRFFPFPDDVVLVPGGYVTIFGGGTPVDIPGIVLFAEGQIGNGLSSDGDGVHLIMPDGKTVVQSVRVPKATPDVSWLFSPDDPPKLHPQISGARAMSPGTPSISEVKSDTLTGVGAVSGKPIVSDLEIENPKWGIYPSPNPFNTATVLDFYTAGGPVYVTIYNILGQPIRRLVQQHLPAGYYRRIWDGKNDSGVSVGSGIYIVLLKDKKATFTHRVTLLK